MNTPTEPTENETKLGITKMKCTQSLYEEMYNFIQGEETKSPISILLWKLYRFTESKNTFAPKLAFLKFIYDIIPNRIYEQVNHSKQEKVDEQALFQQKMKEIEKE